MNEAAVQTKGRRRGRPLRKGNDVGRQALVDTARRLLTTTEPTLLTRQMVAEAASVDPNLIRYYFGNMQKLISEVVASTHRRSRADMISAREIGDPAERIRYRIRRLFRLFYENPNFHKLVASTLYDDQPSDSHDEWIDLLKGSLADLNEVLTLGAQQEMFKDVEPGLLYMLIISACEFWGSNLPVVRALFGVHYEEGKLEERYVEFIFDVVMNGIVIKPIKA